MVCAPVFPIDYAYFGIAGMDENINAEPVKHMGVDAHEQEGVPTTDIAPILTKRSVSIAHWQDRECHCCNEQLYIGAQGTGQRRCHNTQQVQAQGATATG